MSRRIRIGIFVPAALGFTALLLWAFAGLPAFGDYRGPYGFLLNAIATPERHTTNVVMATTFDYRGFDTMGEEFVLFAAVLGVMLLLRSAEAGGRSGAPEHESSAAIRWGATLAVAAAVLVGLWLIAFGYVTPGGGFQGGVAVAGATILLYFATGYRAFEPVGSEEVLDPLEALGAGGFVVIGLASLAGGLAFLTNLFGPGIVGTLQSGGSIPFVNWAAGVEVAAANVSLFAQFLRHYVVPLARAQE